MIHIEFCLFSFFFCLAIRNRYNEYSWSVAITILNWQLAIDQSIKFMPYDDDDEHAKLNELHGL